MLNITDPAEARKIIRADKYDKQTAGIAGKYSIIPLKFFKCKDLEHWINLPIDFELCPVISIGTSSELQFLIKSATSCSLDSE